MQSLNIDGRDLVRVVKAGCIKLEQNREEVNLLNVFPVPDGDTGTNMYLTLLSAVKEGEKNADESLGKVAKAISMGSLMGARGNSGVILSQIFRGIAKVLENKETIDAMTMADALKSGTETAYKAVMKPVEGTILTVIRSVADACQCEAEKDNDLMSTLLYGIQEGYKTLEKTPQMLPVLKEAGVVDAGGQGLLYFLQGVVEGIASEKDLDFAAYRTRISVKDEQAAVTETVNLDYLYCTELLIKGSGLDAEVIKDRLGSLGDSMLVVGEDELVKVHIHSNHPGKVLETALRYGQISDVKINNMAEEVHENKLIKEELARAAETVATVVEDRIGVVAVAAGEGVAEILASLGVEEIVQGGQTMNPSAEDLLNACMRINTSKVIILPNNGNIILAAEQVTHLCTEKQVAVVPTKSVMQAIAALISFTTDADLEEVVEEMKEEMSRVQYGEITFAVRDSAMNGLDIKTGDILGLVNGKICCKAEGRDEALDQILERMMNEEAEIITLLYGDGVTEEEAEATQVRVSEKYEGCEIELHYGGQAYYAYLVSVE